MPRQASPSAEPGLNGEAHALAERLHAAAIALLRSARRDDLLSGLSPSRASALSVVVYRGPLSMSELAAAEQVRGPTMTRLVQGLEEAGLVARSADPADGRVVRLRATSEGRRVLEAARQRRLALLAPLFAALPAAQREELGRAADVLLGLFRPTR